MIRHYSSFKENLVNAAYQAHKRAQTEMSQATQDNGGGNARQHLARLVHASVTPSAVEPMALSLGAGFIHMVRRDSAMRATHEQTCRHYRDLLQAMIAAALAKAGRSVTGSGARRLAIACNAVIDGRWLEGGAFARCLREQRTEPDRLALGRGGHRLFPDGRTGMNTVEITKNERRI